MLDSAGVPAELHGEALVAVDKLDKIGRRRRGDGAGRARDRRRPPSSVCSALFAAALRGATADADATGSSALAAHVAGHADGEAASRTCARSCAWRGDERRPHIVLIDPSLARGLSYYTGAIFEIAVADLAGSLGGGGRYDDLIGMFSGENVPACGFSLGPRADPRRDGRAEHVPGARAVGRRPTCWSRCSMVTPTRRRTRCGSRPSCAATRLARRGVSGAPTSSGKQFKYARRAACHSSTVVGDDERGGRHGDDQEHADRRAGRSSPAIEAAAWLAPTNSIPLNLLSSERSNPELDDA